MQRGAKLGLLMASSLYLWGAAPTDRALEKLFSHIPPGSATRANVEAEYRFTVDYISADAQGAPATTQRVIGIYSMNTASGATSWRSVTTGSAQRAPNEIESSERQRYMEGMHYDRSAKPFAPDFFAGFPAQAVQEKNLVWDTWMFDEFIHGYFQKLQPNVAIPFASGDVSLGGAGSFHNRDVRLIWTGLSRRNGRDCALVHYEAFLNTFSTTVPGFTIVGRSEYWGDMWVALDSRTLEYATLREEVVGTITGEQSGPRPMHVLRVGSVERVN